MGFTLVVIGVLGLIIGVWLGLPGRYTQTPEDIERLMEKGGGRRRRAKRVFTPLAWLQRRVTANAQRASRPVSGKRGFKLEAPGGDRSGASEAPRVGRGRGRFQLERPDRESKDSTEAEAPDDRK